MQTLCITGADGFLGSRAAAYYQTRFRVLPLGHAALDITDAAAVRRYLAAERPDFLLHCAAVSDTGEAEREPVRSRSVNVAGTVNLAAACAATGTGLVYMSSDQVYNGCRRSGPLGEDEPLNPQSVYAAEKWEAERKVAALLPAAVGLRLTWLYDLPGSGYRMNRNLVVNLLAASRENRPLTAAVRDFRGVTDVWAVVERLADCFSLPGGVYNFGSGCAVNSFALFCGAARLLGADPAPVRPDTGRYPDFARNLSMDCQKLAAQGITFPASLPGLAAALARGAHE